MTDWVPDLNGLAGPKYRALAEALTAAIGSGALKPGARLPPQRELAQALGVDLTTVTRAYNVARQRGLIDGRGKAGSFVRETATHSIYAAAQVDTGLNTPPVPTGGILQDSMRRAFDLALEQGAGSALQYQAAGGDPVICQAGADLAARLALKRGRDQFVLSAGGQNALLAVSRAVLVRGSKVACGEFIYPGFRAIASRLGVELLPLQAMTAEVLELACRQNDITALYTVPTNDNPTATTIPFSERQRIAEVAQRHRLQIIEDDAYGLLPRDPLPAIASLVPGQAWHILSMSKIISPALRIAFVSAPTVADALRLTAEVHDTAVMPPPLNAAMVASWLREGTFDSLVSAVRAESEWRSELAGQILKDHSINRHP
ncbi:MAG: PLP-dependent aminotransferase family protein, partial [Pseudomonadota bacterium]|nr:PLP-dependent aminotransferase family protein [Pseudomonadota bacterium]